MGVLNDIVEKLSRVIPSPAKKAARPSASFRKLKVGQLLMLRVGEKLYTPELTSLRAGAYLTVVEVNSLGAKLKPADMYGGELETFGSVWWKQPEWEKTFEKVRKVKRPKAKAKV